MTMLAKMSTAPRKKMFSAVNVIMLNQLCDILHILAFIEARLKDWLILEVSETQQLKGAELVVVAQADFQSEVSVGTSHGLALLLDVGSHLVERHV